jgi:phage terminase small subunit
MHSASIQSSTWHINFMAKKIPRERLSNLRTEDGLTPQQDKFAREYAYDPNGTASAIRANYSSRSAAAIASELLTKPKILAAVKHYQALNAEKFQLKKDRWMAELMAIAFSDHGDVSSWDDDRVNLVSSEDMEPEARRSIQQTESQASEFGRSVRIKQYDKIKALELLGKSAGFLDGSTAKPDRTALKEKLLQSLGKYLTGGSSGSDKD